MLHNAQPAKEHDSSGDEQRTHLTSRTFIL